MTTSAEAAQVQLTGWLATVVALAVVVCAVLSLVAVRVASGGCRTNSASWPRCRGSTGSPA